MRTLSGENYQHANNFIFLEFAVKISPSTIVASAVFLIASSCTKPASEASYSEARHTSFLAQESLSLYYDGLEVRTELLNRRYYARCARIRNFFCIKSPPGTRWNGQISKDSGNHAEFSDPVMSARAFYKNMYTYRFKHDLRSAREIFNRYAPSSDCIGSLRRDPITHQCPRGENAPVQYARSVATQAGVGLEQDLNLFLSHDLINKEVAIYLGRAVLKYELGFKYDVTDTFLLEGMKRAGFLLK